MGQLLRWLINEQECTFYGLKLPTGFQMIGQTNLRSYEEWLKYFGAHSQDKVSKKKVTKRAYARIGVSPSLQYSYMYTIIREFSKNV